MELWPEAVPFPSFVTTLGRVCYFSYLHGIRNAGASAKSLSQVRLAANFNFMNTLLSGHEIVNPQR